MGRVWLRDQLWWSAGHFENHKSAMSFKPAKTDDTTRMISPVFDLSSGILGRSAVIWPWCDQWCDQWCEVMGFTPHCKQCSNVVNVTEPCSFATRPWEWPQAPSPEAYWKYGRVCDLDILIHNDWPVGVPPGYITLRGLSCSAPSLKKNGCHQ